MKVFNDMSRRLFLKSAGAFAGAAALAGCSTSKSDDSFTLGPIKPTAIETKHDCSCFNNCGNGCRLYAHVRNGRIVKMSRAPMFPDRRFDRACLRGLSQMQRYYSPNRLLYPMKRVGGERGDKSAYIRIGWEQAVSEIASKLTEILTDSNLTHGRSVAYHMGTGNFGTIHGRDVSYSRFFNYIGAMEVLNSLDQNTAQGISLALGQTNVWNATVANMSSDIANAKTIIMWGTNLASACIQSWHHAAAARDDKGAEIISIDIMMSGGSARADKFVHLRPTTDVLFALSIIKELIERGDVNKEYMLLNTSGYFLIKDSDDLYLDGEEVTGNPADAGKFVGIDSGGNVVLTESGRHADKAYFPSTYTTTNMNIEYSGAVNSHNVRTAFKRLSDHVGAAGLGDATNRGLGQYDASVTVSLTGVDRAVVEEMANRYSPSHGPVFVVSGFGPDHHSNGHHIYLAICTLAAITGNFGKSGTSLSHGSPITPYSNKSALTAVPDSVSALDWNPSKAGGGSIPFPVLKDIFDGAATTTYNHYGQPAAMYPTGGTDENFFGVPAKIRAMFIFFSNMATNYCETQNTANILTQKDASGNYKMKLVVVSDTEWTDTAVFADYILPAAHWFEREDYNGFGSHPFLVYQEKVMKPMQESLPDLDIARKLANAMGYNNLYPETDEENFSKGVTEASHAAWLTLSTGQTPTPDKLISATRVRNEKVVYAFPTTKVNGKDESIWAYRYDPTGNAADRSVEPDIRIPTSTGRIEFFVNKNTALGLGITMGVMTPLIMDNEILPTFEPAYETWDANWDGASGATSALYPNTTGTAQNSRNTMVSNTYLDKHPFHNFSQRIRWRVHSQWWNIPWIRELEPYPVVYISSYDAKNTVEGGPVTNGDVVTVYNDRGSYRGTVRVSPGLRPGVIDAPRGWQRWQYDEHYGKAAGYSLESGAADAGSCNDVTSRRVHAFSACQAFFDARVAIKKITKA